MMKVDSYSIQNPRDLQIQRLLEQVEGFSNHCNQKKISSLVMEYFRPDDVTLTLHYDQKEYRFFLFSSLLRMEIGSMVFCHYPSMQNRESGDGQMSVRVWQRRWDYEGEMDESYVYIESLNVDGEYQNLGFGSFLVRAVIEWSVQNECEARVDLTASANAIWWYYGLGFRFGDHVVVKNESSDVWEYVDSITADNRIASLIKVAKEKGQKPDSSSVFVMTTMYLPALERLKWVDIVKREPPIVICE